MFDANSFKTEFISRGDLPKVYILQSSRQNENSFEDAKGGVYSNALCQEWMAMGPQNTVGDVMKRVHDAVAQLVHVKQGANQNPTTDYIGNASPQDIMKKVVVKTERVLLIVPKYSGGMNLPGARASAQYFIRHVASKSFSPSCVFEIMIDEELELPVDYTSLTMDFQSRVTFHKCTQETVREKLEEVAASGQNVMIKLYCHGKKSNDDEFVYFEEGDKARRISGKFLVQLMTRFMGDTLVVVADMCYAGGLPDRGDLQEVGLVARVDGRTGRLPQYYDPTDSLMECSELPVIPTLDNLCDTFTRQIGIAPNGNKFTLSVTNESDDQIVLLNMTKDGGDRMVTYSSGKNPMSPTAPVSVPAEKVTSPPAPVSVPAEKVTTPVKEDTDPELKPRGVAVAGATMLAGLTTLLNSFAAAWSVWSATMLGLPAFLSSNAPTLMFVPLIAAGIVLAISGLVALGFYLFFIRKHYAQVLSPVILTTLLSVAAQYLCGTEFLQTWFPQDTMFGAMLGSFVISFLTILFAIAMNWKTIKRSEMVMLVFKSLVEQSADCMQLAMLLIHTYFVGGGHNYRQTMHIQNGGIDYYAVYRPLTMSTHTGKLECSFPLANGKHLWLESEYQYSLFNETYGVTCQYDVFLTLIRKYSDGQADSLCKWEREDQIYDLRGLRSSREALIRNFGLNGQGVPPDQLDMAFEPENCEITEACFHAPALKPNWNISYVEKGLTEISEPFHKLMDVTGKVIGKAIEIFGEIAYPPVRGGK